jgi:hypothetical protein
MHSSARNLKNLGCFAATINEDGSEEPEVSLTTAVGGKVKKYKAPAPAPALKQGKEAVNEVAFFPKRLQEEEKKMEILEAQEEMWCAGA